MIVVVQWPVCSEGVLAGWSWRTEEAQVSIGGGGGSRGLEQGKKYMASNSATPWRLLKKLRGLALFP